MTFTLKNIFSSTWEVISNRLDSDVVYNEFSWKYYYQVFIAKGKCVRNFDIDLIHMFFWRGVNNFLVNEF